MACENEIIQELPQEVSKTEGITAKENQKIDVCHKGNIISISVNPYGEGTYTILPLDDAIA